MRKVLALGCLLLCLAACSAQAQPAQADGSTAPATTATETAAPAQSTAEPTESAASTAAETTRPEVITAVVVSTAAAQPARLATERGTEAPSASAQGQQMTDAEIMDLFNGAIQAMVEQRPGYQISVSETDIRYEFQDRETGARLLAIPAGDKLQGIRVEKGEENPLMRESSLRPSDVADLRIAPLDGGFVITFALRSSYSQSTTNDGSVHYSPIFNRLPFNNEYMMNPNRQQIAGLLNRFLPGWDGYEITIRDVWMEAELDRLGRLVRLVNEEDHETVVPFGMETPLLGAVRLPFTASAALVITNRERDILSDFQY